MSNFKNRERIEKLEKMTGMISNVVRRNEKAIADLTILITMKMKEEIFATCPDCNKFFPVK